MRSAQAVWKYVLEIEDAQSFSMPADAVALSVQFQPARHFGAGRDEHELVLWALVHREAPFEHRRIRVVGTGNPCDVAGWQYVGTAQEPGRPLVWHVFIDEPEARP